MKMLKVLGKNVILIKFRVNSLKTNTFCCDKAFISYNPFKSLSTLA